MSGDPAVIMRISQMKQDIEKVKARQISNQAVIGGVTDHLYLSNRGTYTHAQLDVAYAITYSLYSTVSILNVTATSAWNKAVSAYSVASAAYVEAYLAYSSASTANTAAASAWTYAASAYYKAVSVASTASTHYTSAASFHGFSIASHAWGTLYDNGTNYVELPMGAASYVYTSGGSSSSPYWKAPSTGSAAYDADLMIGSANAAWVPMIFEVEATVGKVKRTSIAGDLSITNVDGSDTTTIYKLPLSTNRGGKKLYINKMRLGVRAATSTDYISTTQLYGSTWSVDTQIAAYETDIVAPALTTITSSLLDAGSFPTDVSAYERVLGVINYAVTTASLCRVAGFDAEVYYDT